MYIATEDDRLWLQDVQRKLYARSREQPDYVFEQLWGLVTDPRNLRIAFGRVQRNRGARTAGIDRITIGRIVQDDVSGFLDAVRKDLRDGSFRPSPVRRVLIPKAGKPGAFRPLGIPAPGDSDRERPGHPSCDEVDPGADLRGWVLPDLVWL